MLDSLYIKNFRLFKELTIEHLGRVNLIVGRNNTGKSCLLEAIQIYASNASASVLTDIFARREENIEPLSDIDGSLSPLINLFYNYRFPMPETDEDMMVIGSYKQLQNRLITRHGVRGNNDGINTLWTEFFKKGELIKLFDEKDWCLYPHYPKNQEKLKNQVVRFVPTHYLDKVKVSALWNTINLTDKQPIIVKGLQLIEPKIQNIALTVSHNPIPIVRLSGYSEPRPLSSMGDGLARVFHFMLTLVNAKEGFLLIDEFENGLHYTVQPKVWEIIFKLAEELNVQVFVTTHSWDCVTAFVETTQKDETEAMLFHLGRSALKSDDNKVIATAYDKEELELVTIANLEVR